MGADVSVFKKIEFRLVDSIPHEFGVSLQNTSQISGFNEKKFNKTLIVIGNAQKTTKLTDFLRNWVGTNDRHF